MMAVEKDDESDDTAPGDVRRARPQSGEGELPTSPRAVQGDINCFLISPCAVGSKRGAPLPMREASLAAVSSFPTDDGTAHGVELSAEPADQRMGRTV
mmetsp:Transcript_18856/g.48089  ORF Transcript_18856/g.48089 Transcript_18856/m.48089 type:complete len:98 (+) Transcript_18856:649-942(+)